MINIHHIYVSRCNLMQGELERIAFLYPIYPILRHFILCAFRSLPYLACQAKKYNSAARGWPIKTNDTQKIVLPMIFP
jgi:hypothetical protein